MTTVGPNDCRANEIPVTLPEIPVTPTTADQVLAAAYSASRRFRDGSHVPSGILAQYVARHLADEEFGPANKGFPGAANGP